ncbi:MAG TPA: tetratricopeptide repeat protein [Candidatus Omnitrophica bacterium]|nr:tetratricopeptide repeat protein [Candidatus Omnitrophota bacterium]
MNISIGRKFIFIPLILSLLVFCGYRWYLHSILLPLRKNCGNKLVLNYFGMVLYERGYEEKSVKLWERALEIDPNFVPALNNIATYYSHNGRALESIKLERRTIQLDPNNAVYHYNLSTFYFVYRYITAREFG